MTLTLSPSTVTSFPGMRLSFSVLGDSVALPLSSGDYEVIVYFPGEEPINGLIHESNNTFSWVVPPNPGSHTVNVLIKEIGVSEEWASFEITVNPAQAPRLRFSFTPDYALSGSIFIDVYDPLGNLLHSEDVTSQTGPNYSLNTQPQANWLQGEYRIVLRDANGVQDVDSAWVQSPELISMASYFTLPNWQQQLIHYIKYDMMGDTDPLHPGAWLTLEEYARHWRNIIQELNQIPPYTDFAIEGIPPFWANVATKGTLCRVFLALANRSVPIPVWTGVPTPMQDESHYRESWQRRYDALRPEYLEERAYVKGRHLPGPSVTVDPWLGWGGTNLAGTAGLSLIGHPTWATRPFGWRG